MFVYYLVRLKVFLNTLWLGIPKINGINVFNTLFNYYRIIAFRLHEHTNVKSHCIFIKFELSARRIKAVEFLVN